MPIERVCMEPMRPSPVDLLRISSASCRSAERASRPMSSAAADGPPGGRFWPSFAFASIESMSIRNATMASSNAPRRFASSLSERHGCGSAARVVRSAGRRGPGAAPGSLTTARGRALRSKRSSRLVLDWGRHTTSARCTRAARQNSRADRLHRRVRTNANWRGRRDQRAQAPPRSSRNGI